MVARLLFLLTVIPIIELMLLIKLGTKIGTFYTILIILITGIVGVFLVKTQGFIIIKKIKYEISCGNMPGKYLLDGLLVLVGGLFLITPGIITDISGFLFILPGSRNLIRTLLIRKLRQMFDNGTINIFINRW